MLSLAVLTIRNDCFGCVHFINEVNILISTWGVIVMWLDPIQWILIHDSCCLPVIMKINNSPSAAKSRVDKNY